MAGTKVDQRVLVTKRLLREALLELMKEKTISKITPTELCRKAGINRNTFYAHYRAPEDVLREIEDEFLTECQQSFDESLNYESIEQLVTECVAIFIKYADICTIIFSENSDSRGLEQLVNMARAKSSEEWKRAGLPENDIEREFFHRYCTAGTVSVIREWIKNGMRESPQRMADVLAGLNHGALLGIKSREKNHM